MTSSYLFTREVPPVLLQGVQTTLFLLSLCSVCVPCLRSVILAEWTSIMPDVWLVARRLMLESQHNGTGRVDGYRGGQVGMDDWI